MYKILLTDLTEDYEVYGRICMCIVLNDKLKSVNKKYVQNLNWKIQFIWSWAN